MEEFANYFHGYADLPLNGKHFVTWQVVSQSKEANTRTVSFKGPCFTEQFIILIQRHNTKPKLLN